MMPKTAVVAAMILAGTTLVGCTGPSADPSPATSPSASACGDSGAATEPIASETIVPDPAAPDDTTEVAIESLTVEGEIMILRYSATPDFASRSDAEPISLDDAMGSGATYVSSQMSLIDRANLKAYAVLYASPGWWAADDVDTVNGEPARSYAVFAAPEDDIDVIDVSFSQQFPELGDVPITTGAP